jgi:hypothetical protein
MSSTQPGRTVKRRHLHYVLRTANPESRTPMFDSVESWNWAVRISVVGLFVLALAVVAFKMASVVVPVVLAWVVAMVLLPVVDGLERAGLIACAYIGCPGHPPDRKHNGDCRGPDRSADLLAQAGE